MNFSFNFYIFFYGEKYAGAISDDFLRVRKRNYESALKTAKIHATKAAGKLAEQCKEIVIYDNNAQRLIACKTMKGNRFAWLAGADLQARQLADGCFF